MPFADISAVVEEDRLGIAPTALRHEAPNVRAPIRRESSAERPRRNPFRMVLPEDRVGPRPVTVRLVRLAAEHVVRHAGLLDVLREFLGRLHRDDGLAERPGLLRPPADEGHALLRRKVREPEVHDVRRSKPVSCKSRTTSRSSAFSIRLRMAAYSSALTSFGFAAISFGGRRMRASKPFHCE